MTRRHIPALDGVRGLAILLVLVAHLTVWGTSTPDRVSRNVALLGFSGVDLFFVLSGFLITGILWENRELRRFWIRRVLRIWPLYLAVLAGLFVVLPAFKGWHEYPMPELWADRWFYWLHATNIKAALQHSLAFPYDTGHFWSLAVEEQFYLVWPLVVWRIRTLDGLLRVSLWLVGAAWLLRLVVGGVAGDITAEYVLMPTRMDGLAMGAAIFALSAQNRLDRWRRPAAVAGLVTLAIGAALMPIRTASPWLETGMHLAFSLCQAAVLTRVLTGSAPVVDRAWLRILGRYSYGIYVFHVPLVLVLLPFRDWAQRLPAIGGWSLPGALVFFAGSAALSLGIAMVSYHAYERHFLALKDRRRVRDRVGMPADDVMPGI